jgi:hypothetical protein
MGFERPINEVLVPKIGSNQGSEMGIKEFFNRLGGSRDLLFSWARPYALGPGLSGKRAGRESSGGGKIREHPTLSTYIPRYLSA